MINIFPDYIPECIHCEQQMKRILENSLPASQKHFECQNKECTVSISKYIEVTVYSGWANNKEEHLEQKKKSWDAKHSNSKYYIGLLNNNHILMELHSFAFNDSIIQIHYYPESHHSEICIVSWSETYRDFRINSLCSYPDKIITKDNLLEFQEHIKSLVSLS